MKFASAISVLAILIASCSTPPKPPEVDGTTSIEIVEDRFAIDVIKGKAGGYSGRTFFVDRLPPTNGVDKNIAQRAMDVVSANISSALRKGGFTPAKSKAQAYVLIQLRMFRRPLALETENYSEKLDRPFDGKTIRTVLRGKDINIIQYWVQSQVHDSMKGSLHLSGDIWGEAASFSDVEGLRRSFEQRVQGWQPKAPTVDTAMKGRPGCRSRFGFETSFDGSGERYRDIVVRVNKGGSAQKAGLKVGDEVVLIGSVRHLDWLDQLGKHPELSKKPIQMVVSREKKALNLEIPPAMLCD